MRQHTCAGLLICWAVAAVGEPIDRTIDAERDGELEVNNFAGEISIEGWDRDEVRVTGELSDEAERLDVLSEGDRIIVRVVMPERANRGGWGGDTDTDLYINAPSGMSVHVNAVSADVAIEGMQGDQELATVSGDVRTEGLGEDMFVRTVSGDIWVRGRDNLTRTEAAAVSGDIRLDGVRGEVRAQTVSGDVGVDGEIVGRVELQTVSGDGRVRAELSDNARVRATTTSGDVELFLRGSAAAEYEVSTFSGDIDNCFGPRAPSDDGPPGRQFHFTEGDSRARVNVTTMSGDIDICRD